MENVGADIGYAAGDIGIGAAAEGAFAADTFVHAVHGLHVHRLPDRTAFGIDGRNGLKDLPLRMNPITPGTSPNYWLSALIIDEEYMCRQVRDACTAVYTKEHGKTCPTEILEAIAGINAEGRPIWKPMHMQPLYRMHEAIGREGTLRCQTNAYIAGGVTDVGADIFRRGCCLPSDNKMTAQQQERIIEVIKGCFE